MFELTPDCNIGNFSQINWLLTVADVQTKSLYPEINVSECCAKTEHIETNAVTIVLIVAHAKVGFFGDKFF